MRAVELSCFETNGKVDELHYINKGLATMLYSSYCLGTIGSLISVCNSSEPAGSTYVAETLGEETAGATCKANPRSSDFFAKFQN